MSVPLFLLLLRELRNILEVKGAGKAVVRVLPVEVREVEAAVAAVLGRARQQATNGHVKAQARLPPTSAKIAFAASLHAASAQLPLVRQLPVERLRGWANGALREPLDLQC